MNDTHGKKGQSQGAHSNPEANHCATLCSNLIWGIPMANIIPFKYWLNYSGVEFPVNATKSFKMIDSVCYLTTKPGQKPQKPRSGTWWSVCDATQTNWQYHISFHCESPRASRAVLRLSARASSDAPWWLIWLLRRSRCVSVLLEAKPSQKSEKASSHTPNAFHSRTSLQTAVTRLCWLTGIGHCSLLQHYRVIKISDLLY